MSHPTLGAQWAENEVWAWPCCYELAGWTWASFLDLRSLVLIFKTWNRCPLSFLSAWKFSEPAEFHQKATAKCWIQTWVLFPLMCETENFVMIQMVLIFPELTLGWSLQSPRPSNRLLAYWDMTEIYWEHLGVSESLHEVEQYFHAGSFSSVYSLRNRESFMVLLPAAIALSLEGFVAQSLHLISVYSDPWLPQVWNGHNTYFRKLFWRLIL